VFVNILRIIYLSINILIPKNIQIFISQDFCWHSGIFNHNNKKFIDVEKFFIRDILFN